MTLPAKILLAAAIADRSDYEEIQKDGEHVHFSDLEAMVWKAVAAYYERDAAAVRAETEVIGALAGAGLTNPKHIKRLGAYLAGLAEVSAPNVSAVLLESRRRRVGDALSAALAARRSEDTERLLAEYCALGEVGSPDGETSAVVWEGLVTRRRGEDNRIQVTPKNLNALLGGGLLPGHNVTLFARPDAGKSAFCISLAAGFARRGHKVLYVINEDAAADIGTRMIANLSGFTMQEIDRRPDEAEDLAKARGVENITLLDLVPSTVEAVAAAVRKYEPAILIVDQLRNLRVAGKSDSYTQTLDSAARAIRDIGKKYGIVTISATQAGDSASGKAVLEMSDIDSSKTGIPGAADLLLGIGCTETLERAGQRMISICKNKVSGDRASLVVKLDTFRSRVTSA